jgi:hypothetical protein
MGGAVGHLYHLYDNPDLTFGEIKDIIKSAAAGKLEQVSEKLDGLNLVFTWDESGSGLRVARNAGDIKSGGMDANALAAKFADRGNLADAFNSAFKVLNQALGSLPPAARAKVFGPDGRIWYSMELIYSANPNVIQYDGNNVVFHGWPVFKAMPDGTVEKGPGGGVGLLSKHIEQMQKHVKEKDWNVRGPALVALKKMSNKAVPQKALTAINRAMANARVGDDDTIQDYLFNYAIADAKAAKMPPAVLHDIAARVAGIPGAPNLTQIKSKIDKSLVPAVQDYVKAGPKMIKSAIAPIESAIHEFAVEVLRGLTSTLISNSPGEVDRLRGEVQKAISAIEASGNEQAMSILKTQMAKLGNIENLATPMEGVVFIHNGNAYKFTGAFAPVNQILGLFKYGRGKTKLASEGLDLLSDLIQEALMLEDDERFYQKDAQDAQNRYDAALSAIESWKKKRAAERAREEFIQKSGFSLDKAGRDRFRRRAQKDPQLLSNLKKFIDAASSDSISDLELPKDLKDELEVASKRLRIFDPSRFDWSRPKKEPVVPRDDKEAFSEEPLMNLEKALSTDGWIDWRQFEGSSNFPSYGSARKDDAPDQASAEERADVGTGPGEKRLARIFGGIVKGGGVSYDVVTPDGRKWEVKALESPSETIRPGTEGKAALSKTRDLLSTIMRQLMIFSSAAQKSIDSFEKPSHKEMIRWISDFVRSEYEEIVGKGEVTDERFKELETALVLVSRLQKELNVDKKSFPTVVGLNDKKIDVDKPTFLDVAKTVQKLTGREDILTPFQKHEIVFSVLKNPAFRDPKTFFKNLFSSVKASEVFRGVDGVFIVNRNKGFYPVLKDSFDDVFKFVKISQATPRFKFTKF